MLYIVYKRCVLFTAVLYEYMDIRIIRSCSMEDNILQLAFTSVMLGRMTYAISTWWGYATAAGQQRFEACIRRAVRAGLYPADGPKLHQLVSDRDDATNNGESTSCRLTASTVTTYYNSLWTTR